ncbi:hypothetical protein Tco_0684865 [Tanacetum coccineum]
MCIDELHKFSDGTLNNVRSALDDILKRIRMEYLPQTVWRNVDRERAGAMIQAIVSQLEERRLMRCPRTKFSGGSLILKDGGKGTWFQLSYRFMAHLIPDDKYKDIRSSKYMFQDFLYYDTVRAFLK